MLFSPLRLAKTVLSGLLIFASAASARISDTPQQMDARILRPDVGRYFSLRGLDAREQNQLLRDLPVTEFASLLPPDSRELIYWKSAVGRQLSNVDGWRVHVYYWKNRSVLEAYRRVGPGLNEFEVNGLLNLHRGGESWRKVDKKGPQPKDDTVIGYDYELGEDGLRARVRGNWMLIYLTRFDKLLVERKKVQDELADAEQAKKRLEDQSKAPESIAGF